MKTYFFGWANIKWFLRELNKMYSGGEVSFYSKKRIESGIGFIILQWGMIFYLIVKIDKMDMYEMGLWASIEGMICGYMLKQIENASRGPVKPNEDLK